MFSNKIKVFLLTSICLIFFFLTYNDVKSKEITTHNLLDNFDICQTNSSLGQYCKDERFNYLEYFKNSKIQINNNKIHYEFDTWDYHFEITKNTKNEVKFIIEDNAKEASYLTKSEIVLRFDEENLIWNLYSDETLYPESERRKYFYLSGKAKVIDGDTIKINDQKIRFSGIDAPESNYRGKEQTCLIEDTKISCGKLSTEFLKNYIEKEDVFCKIEEKKDQFKRNLGECFLKRLSLSKLMVRNGYAFDYEKYSKGKFKYDQVYAQKNKLGMWSMKFEFPWEFRKKN
ncbi:thermonuclease family protein [Candidatus Pelagibacter sp.]|uniref:thermonuclease family protein n=1 Tax=Candidatus Pelagibacter sp. TaxID=2024849 RepID=UPI003F865B62